MDEVRAELKGLSWFPPAVSCVVAVVLAKLMQVQSSWALDSSILGPGFVSRDDWGNGPAMQTSPVPKRPE